MRRVASGREGSSNEESRRSVGGDSIGRSWSNGAKGVRAGRSPNTVLKHPVCQQTEGGSDNSG